MSAGARASGQRPLRPLRSSTPPGRPTCRPTNRPARAAAARIVLATRRRLWRSNRSTDLDDAGRTAVVDLERMVAGAGEQGAEVDQPGRIGAVVAVDRLVVVAHPEHRAAGRRQQPDEQQVGGREVLELVDEHQPARTLRGHAGLRAGRAGSRSPGRSGRRSRRHRRVPARRGTAATPRRDRRRRRRTAARPRAGRRSPSRIALNASIHGATGSVLRRFGKPISFDSTRRTSGSSIVRHDRGWVRNGETPLTMASAIALSVRTCRPGRSAVRSRISSWARLLKATRLTALGGSRQPTSRWRARSVSTRVLPEPAGAMMRAAPPAVHDGRELVGGEVGARHVGQRTARVTRARRRRRGAPGQPSTGSVTRPARRRATPPYRREGRRRPRPRTWRRAPRLDRRATSSARPDRARRRSSTTRDGAARRRRTRTVGPTRGPGGARPLAARCRRSARSRRRGVRTRRLADARRPAAARARRRCRSGSARTRSSRTAVRCRGTTTTLRPSWCGPRPIAGRARRCSHR